MSGDLEAFDVQHIRGLIAFDQRNPTILQLGPWLATVPDVYRSLAQEAARQVCEPMMVKPVQNADRDLFELAAALGSKCIELRQQAAFEHRFERAATFFPTTNVDGEPEPGMVTLRLFQNGMRALHLRED